MDIKEYFQLTKINPISKLKISYLNYLKVVYEQTNDESIKEKAHDLKIKSHLEIAKMFENEYELNGCSCNAGAITINKRGD